MRYEISNPSPKDFSHLLIRATEMLNLYRAELARILGLTCNDIAQVFFGKQHIMPGSRAWLQGMLFIELYQELYLKLNADDVAIYHWLRKNHTGLPESPFMLIVDKGKLQQVLQFVKTGKFN